MESPLADGEAFDEWLIDFYAAGLAADGGRPTG
jgi:hypothetical protein